ncbi:MAG: HAMP domain-containing protein [Elusimicrobia bacterium]|nr:HAMP domain-containing protein [Elusimicrobiota bacterium]
MTPARQSASKRERGFSGGTGSSFMKIFRSVAFKLSLLSSLFVLGVIAIMARSIFRQIEQSMFAEMRLRTEFFARSCREALFPKVDEFSLHFQVQEMLKEKAVLYAEVMGPQGRILSHSDSKRVGELDSSALARRACACEVPLLQTTRDASTAEEAYDLSVPVRMVSRRIGTARIGFSRSSVRAALAGSQRQILLVSLIAIALAVLGTTLIVGWIMRPLPMLAAAAREVGRGNFNVSVEWKSRDEIGVLARAFNEMTVANSLVFASLREEKEKLQTVFDQTHEGVVWTDPAGNFLLVNATASGLLDLREGGSRTIQGALEGFKPIPAWPELLASTDQPRPCEFHRQEPKLYILAGMVKRLGEGETHNGFLYVLRDATIEKREEKLARNFLSIVSHKLRTPLMIVISYLDLLQEEGSGSLNDFQSKAVGTMVKEIEQLHVLVEKLLVYATAQSPETLDLNLRETALQDVIETALRTLSDVIGSPGVRILWSREDISALPRIRVDPVLLPEALKNLLENAIRFNPGRTKEVRIAARVEEGRVRISVADNGPGIPPEEHDKIFRRFYQVDEHFTGQTLGMGLGLPFVQNVVAAHDGKVGLLSEPGKGSEFYFTVPMI